MQSPVRLRTRSERSAAFDLIRSSFAFMDGRIDPPSSVHRMTLETMAVPPSEPWGLGTPLSACVILTPMTDVLYIGKLAVQERHRGQGLARALIDHAEIRAGQLGLGALELKVRVELTENHRAFAAMGFVEVARTAHDGYDRPTSITMRRPVPVPQR